jgi:hypothetical protein
MSDREAKAYLYLQGLLVGAILAMGLMWVLIHTGVM